MKFSAILENGFVKFEVFDCGFKKPNTIARHLRNYVLKKAGIDIDDFVDTSSKQYLEDLRLWDINGDIRLKDNWTCDENGNDCPEYLAFVFEIDDDLMGEYFYAYFGINVSKTGYKVKDGFTNEVPKELEEIEE